jgi:23S rRNA (guanosine2251-2'-O)-methyltransferase
MSDKSRPLKKKQEYILVLHDIRSVYNVGALFRTADAIGISQIIISGYSPTPVDRFGRARTDFAKSALGSEKAIPWQYAKTPYAKIKKLKAEGFHIVGVEQDARSIDYKKLKKSDRMVFVLGTETTGISKTLLKLCDTIIELPMSGMKESLNVSVAGGIILYRVLDR